MKNVLLMTSAIDAAQNLVNVKDPRERLLHYLSSLLSWLKYGPFDQIIFCDNSNTSYPLSRLTDIATKERKAVEVLAFDGNRDSSKLGKGYGEARILEHVFSHSRMYMASSIIWKITGRLFVENVVRLEEMHRCADNVFDGGDTRFFKVHRDLFEENLLPSYKNVDETKGKCIEIVHEDVLRPLFQRNQVSHFKEKPIFLGQAGGTGVVYGEFQKEILEEAKKIRSSFEGY